MTLNDLLPMLAMGISIIVAIVGHEVMHGRTAYRYGDETAKMQGRLSFNPLVHIDLIGTILVPTLMYMSTGFIFGWAKPVPIYMRTVIKNGGWAGAIHVSLAGIVYNFLLALIAAFLLMILNEPTSTLGAFVQIFLTYTVMINVILGVFNLYPIPPLDGSHALSYAASWAGYPKIMHWMETKGRYGFIVLIILILSPYSHYIFLPMKFIINLLLN